MTELSLASLEVWSQYCSIVEEYGPPRLALATALRAVADQVVPPEKERLFIEERPWDVELAGVVDIREQLLAIAAELEGAGARNREGNSSQQRRTLFL